MYKQAGKLVHLGRPIDLVGRIPTESKPKISKSQKRKRNKWKHSLLIKAK
jgi:hypothetical protein